MKYVKIGIAVVFVNALVSGIAGWIGLPYPDAIGAAAGSAFLVNVIDAIRGV